jgi:hypothetical protein
MNDLLQVSKQTRAEPPAGDRTPMICSPMCWQQGCFALPNPHAKMIDTRIYARWLWNESIISSKNFFAAH